MRTMLSVLGVLAFALVATIVVAAPAEPPGEITIDAAMDKKSAVPFNHTQHMELAESCTVCHHTNEDLTADNVASMEVQTCTECHLDPAEDGVPGMREMSLKKNPFHVTCIDCHKAEKAGPTSCNDCHPKE